jgi:hypothetical protein
MPESTSLNPFGYQVVGRAGALDVGGADFVAVGVALGVVGDGLGLCVVGLAAAGAFGVGVPANATMPRTTTITAASDPRTHGSGDRPFVGGA